MLSAEETDESGALSGQAADGPKTYQYIVLRQCMCVHAYHGALQYNALLNSYSGACSATTTTTTTTTNHVRSSWPIGGVSIVEDYLIGDDLKQWKAKHERDSFAPGAFMTENVNICPDPYQMQNIASDLVDSCGIADITDRNVDSFGNPHGPAENIMDAGAKANYALLDASTGQVRPPEV